MVNAEVAHINGENPGSVCYDPDQLDSDRQGFDNLMLLCPKHHKLVDKLRPDDYPVELLQRIKKRHLEHEAEGGWLSEEQAERFAAQLIAELRGTTVSVQAQAAGNTFVDGRAAGAFVVPEETSPAPSGAGGTSSRTTGSRGGGETPEGVALRLVEHDDGSLVLANVGHGDAFTISVRVAGQQHGAVGHPRGVFGGPRRVLEPPHGIELAAIPPPRLSPGRAGPLATEDEYQTTAASYCCWCRGPTDPAHFLSGTSSFGSESSQLSELCIRPPSSWSARHSPTTRPPHRHVGERGRLSRRAPTERSTTLMRFPGQMELVAELMRWPHPADDEVAGLSRKRRAQRETFVSPRPSTSKNAPPSETVALRGRVLRV